MAITAWWTGRIPRPHLVVMRVGKCPFMGGACEGVNNGQSVIPETLNFGRSRSESLRWSFTLSIKLRSTSLKISSIEALKGCVRYVGMESISQVIWRISDILKILIRVDFVLTEIFAGSLTPG